MICRLEQRRTSSNVADFVCEAHWGLFLIQVLKLVFLGRDLVEWDSGQFLRLNGLHLDIIKRFLMIVILDRQREQSQESSLQEEGLDV